MTYQKIYAQKAIEQIPRLLGNLDRNPYSPTYGCFYRDYWLDKTIDFADAVRQFAVHALALVYRYDFPGNIYKGNDKIRDWAVAAMLFWAKIQHKDGSFDEFYPYERGWVGPTAFTTFAVIESFNLLKDEINPQDKQKITQAIKKAAYFIAQGDKEEDHLANHHAMAALALWKAYKLLADNSLKQAYQKSLDVFLTYHSKEEGWSREYDGIDPGYLSATVSFLAKIYQENKDEQLRKILTQSIKTCSFFVYPNGFYAGSLGSRNTLHFYPHGFEIMAAENDLAAAVAEKMLKALAEGKLVPPGIISDRYVVYRVPEFLQAYLDYAPRPDNLPALPYEEDNLYQYFPKAKILAISRPKYYFIANLAKGGVVKVFAKPNNKLIANDCGLIGRLNSGQVVTSQWVDPDYNIRLNKDKIIISGQLNYVPSNKLFTPLKFIIFRLVLLAFGWQPRLAHFIKGQIRRALILGQRRSAIKFERQIKLDRQNIEIQDNLAWRDNSQFESLAIGDEFFVRYVPQSRYFQAQELEVKGEVVSKETLLGINNQKKFFRKIEIKI